MGLENHMVLFDEPKVERHAPAKCDCWACGEMFDRAEIVAPVAFRNYNGAMLPTYPKLCTLCHEEFISGNNPILKPKA